jgi:hypothetical protein
MKKGVVLFVIVLVIAGACGSDRPYYKTAEGKRKQKYYNELQFGGKNETVMRSNRK